jgi:hypothetical protein
VLTQPVNITKTATIIIIIRMLVLLQVLDLLRRK